MYNEYTTDEINYYTPLMYNIDHLQSHTPIIEGLSNADATSLCGFNPDSDKCIDLNKEQLNMVCKSNLTSTRCRDRKNELYESTVKAMCETNPFDPFCSCFTKPPDYVPELVSGLPHCWNKTCATSGYIPTNMRDMQCPDITICKQNISTSGDSNILTGNISVMNCSSTSSPGSDTTDTTTAITTAATTAVSEIEQAKSNTMLYSILFLIVVCIIGVVLFMLGRADNSDEEIAQQYIP